MAFCYTGLRVLLTEDNALCADIVSELLTICHASVRLAMSGEEAVRLIEEGSEQFDAVLMDVQMPGMDGYETTRAIRATGKGAGLAVFAMTAGGEAERQRALDVGMNAFLQKPFEMARFDQALMCMYA